MHWKYQRGRKRKTTAQIDIIERKIKANRRISSTSIKAELQTEINIIISQWFTWSCRSKKAIS